MNPFYKIIICLFILTTFGMSQKAYCANDSIYEARRHAYIDSALLYVNSDAMPIQAYMGVPVDSAYLHGMLAGVATGATSDFEYEQLVRILIFGSGLYDSVILPYLRPVHYWVNANDTLDCYWSENHMIQWMSSHWLLHEYYGIPADPALRTRLTHYLEMKIKYNYNEFFSTVYNPYCLAGILNLADFSQDTVVKNLAIEAAQVLMKDQLMLTNDKGVIYPTAGRNYADHYQGPYGSNIGNVIWMLTGFGPMPIGASHCGAFIATSTIPVDPVIQSWVPTLDTTFIMGQTLDSAYAYNSASQDSLDRIIFQWSAGAYFNPQFAAESFTLISDSSLWRNSVFSVFQQLAGLPVSIVPTISSELGVASYSSILYSDTIVAFKHNSVTLSSVQNYWPGRWGYQQYPCVANVEYTAVYTGSGQVAYDWNNRSATNQNDDLPYVKQIKNVALIMYRPIFKPSLLGATDTTVALHWYNGDYSEIRNDSLWLLGRVNNNYVGVRRAGLKQIDSVWCWDAGTPDAQTWVIIVGDSSMYGSFDNFQAVIDSSHFTTQWYYDTTSNQVTYYASITIDSINIDHAWGVDTSKTTGIETIKTNQLGTMAIYPNPANTSMSIVFDNPALNSQIQVYNMMGQMIYQSSVSDGKVSVPTSQFAEGLYIIKASSDGGTISKSFIISH